MRAHEVATVDLWHQRLNSGDIDGLMALIDPDVEVGGPRGVGRGTLLFREWFGRAAVQLMPRRMFHRASIVVVEQDATWRMLGSDPAASSQVVWSLFEVHGGMITRILRFATLTAALAAAGLDESDEHMCAG